MQLDRITSRPGRAKKCPFCAHAFFNPRGSIALGVFFTGVVTALFAMTLRATEQGDIGPAAAHTQRGVVFVQQGQYADAIDEFTKAIQADPNDPRGYVNRGVAKRTSGRLQDAVPDFSKAIEIAPNDEVAYRERDNAVQQQFEAALSDWLRQPNSIPTMHARTVRGCESDLLMGELADCNRHQKNQTMAYRSRPAIVCDVWRYGDCG